MVLAEEDAKKAASSRSGIETKVKGGKISVQPAEVSEDEVTDSEGDYTMFPAPSKRVRRKNPSPQPPPTTKSAAAAKRKRSTKVKPSHPYLSEDELFDRTWSYMTHLGGYKDSKRERDDFINHHTRNRDIRNLGSFVQNLGRKGSNLYKLLTGEEKNQLYQNRRGVSKFAHKSTSVADKRKYMIDSPDIINTLTAFAGSLKTDYDDTTQEEEDGGQAAGVKFSGGKGSPHDEVLFDEQGWD